MKAILIGAYYNKQSQLDEINNELKNCKCIIDKINISEGTILIVDTITRKDKLEKLKEKSNE